MINNQTVGYTTDGERFSLEEVARKISKFSNTYVVGFFDCCRIPVSVEKGLSEPTRVFEPVNGQCYLMFASPPNQTALAFQDKHLSMATDSFLNFITKTKKPFPFCLDDWDQQGLKVEQNNVKRTHHVFFK
jgi:hypothetical protein